MRLVWIAAVVVLVAACGAGDDATTTTVAPATTTTSTVATTTTSAPTTTETTTTTTTTTTSPPVMVETAVYFLATPAVGASGPFLVPVARETPGSPTDAVAALIAGPGSAESEAGLSSAIPPATRLIDLSVVDGVAAVDLSGDFADTAGSFDAIARLGQLTWTVTRFEEIDGLRLLLDGEVVDVFSAEGLELDDPLTREDFLELRPPILVDTPLYGGEVESSFAMGGVAFVFEATVPYEVLRENGVIADGFFTALDSPPNWGAFSGTVDLGDVAPVAGADYDLILRVWTEDNERGGRDWVMEYPLRLAE